MPEEKALEWDLSGLRGVSLPIIVWHPDFKIIGASGPDQTRPESSVSGELQHTVSWGLHVLAMYRTPEG